MNITLQAPPAVSGDGKEDAAQLNNWCRILYDQLRRVLYSLEDENFIAVSPEKLSSGSINADSITISGTCIKITGNSFEITTPDGEQYIKCNNGKLNISAQSIRSAEA